MFNFLKGVESLESDLRAWALDDYMHSMPPSERDKWRSLISERDLKELAEEVASKCLSELKQSEMFMKINGTPPNLKDNWRYSNGGKLVQHIAKRKGWTINVQGGAAFGFRCTLT